MKDLLKKVLRLTVLLIDNSNRIFVYASIRVYLYAFSVVIATPFWFSRRAYSSRIAKHYSVTVSLKGRSITFKNKLTLMPADLLYINERVVITSRGRQEQETYALGSL